MAYGDEIKQGNITENWLFDFQRDEGAGTLYLAFQDTTDSSNFYHGVILNKPSIRESIDLAKSTAKSSNLSITIPDFSYQGSPISKELFGGSNHYINQTVSVWSKVGAGTKQQIGSFRLTDISSNGDTLQLSLTSHRPWDFISFPQNKHPEYGVYEPIVYGDFSPSSNTNSTGIPTATRRVYPVPVIYHSSTKIYTVMPRSYSASDNAYIHYNAGFNQFVPLRLAEAVYTATSNRVDSATSTTVDNSGLNILGSRIMQLSSGTKYGSAFEGYITTAPSDREVTGSLQFFDDQENMFKWNIDGSISTSTSSDAIYNNSSGETFYALVQTPKKNFHTEYISGVLLGVALEATDGTLDNDQNFTIDFFSNQFDATTDDLLSPNVQRAYNIVYSSGTGAYSTGTGILTFNEPAENSIARLDGCMCPDELLFKCSSISSAIREDNTFKLISMQLHYIAALPTFDGDGGTLSALELSVEKDIETLNKMKYFYCGGDGLEKSYSGGSGAVTEIHEAHRDLVKRFTGIDDTDSNIDGWSALDSDKDWQIRWWQLEPTELKKALEKLQYEGGFIFRFKADSSPQYIHIPDSPTVSNTFTKQDISNVTVRPSPLSQLLTKMDVNYQKHPDGNSYYYSQESSNSSARTNWNIQPKENVKQDNLDAYVAPEIPATPASNPNDDFYTYYDNIFGDIKMLVSCTIVNPKYYDVDVGDIVAFSDMYPETPFGYNSASWSGLKFMITSLNRTLGELKIEAREI